MLCSFLMVFLKKHKKNKRSSLQMAPYGRGTVIVVVLNRYQFTKTLRGRRSRYRKTMRVCGDGLALDDPHQLQDQGRMHSPTRVTLGSLWWVFSTVAVVMFLVDYTQASRLALVFTVLELYASVRRCGNTTMLLPCGALGGVEKQTEDAMLHYCLVLRAQNVDAVDCILANTLALDSNPHYENIVIREQVSTTPTASSAATSACKEAEVYACICIISPCCFIFCETCVRVRAYKGFFCRRTRRFFCIQAQTWTLPHRSHSRSRFYGHYGHGRGEQRAHLTVFHFVKKKKK